MNFQSAEVYVRGNAWQKRETSSLAFDFENAKEAELFESYVRTLFGIQVRRSTRNSGHIPLCDIIFFCSIRLCNACFHGIHRCLDLGRSISLE